MSGAFHVFVLTINWERLTFGFLVVLSYHQEILSSNPSNATSRKKIVIINVVSYSGKPQVILNGQKYCDAWCLHQQGL